ncbi:MAG: insulinase family protein, partial [Treponemataceae bacterium]|nr:insulinase family protein [Treponemataceae bacterium]
MLGRHLALLLILLFLPLQAFPSQLQGYSPEGLEKRVQRFTLKNGLTVLMLERGSTPTVALYTRHRAGAVDEPDGKTGLAHLLEHMLFKGTETLGATDHAREKKILARIFATGTALDREKAKGDCADRRRLTTLQKRLEHLQRKHGQYFVSNEIDRIYKENGAVNFNASTGQDLTTFHVSLPSNRLE